MGILLLVLGRGDGAEARSTLAARFAEKGIAGPGIEQTVVLYLHFFPGDGEAIVGARVGLDPGQIELAGVRSSLGRGRVGGEGLEIDYAEEPLAQECVDTLRVRLVARVEEAQLQWRASIFSSLDPRGEAAHFTNAELAVGPPLGLEIEVIPRRFFPGERTDLRVVVHNRDALRRPIAEVAWEWPAGIAAGGEETITRWDPELQAGDRDTLEWQVRIEPRDSGPLVLKGRAKADGVSGSLIPEVELQMLALPEARLRATPRTLEVGVPGSVAYQWVNTSAEPIELEGLRVEVGEAFARVSVSTARRDVDAAVVGDGEQRSVLLGRVGILEPGDSVQVEVETLPLRAGPFNWRSFAQPKGRREFIPLRRTADLRVVAHQPEDGAAGEGAGQPPTDLQMVQQALGAGLRDRDFQLPLHPGAQLYLRPDTKGKGNWIVEDALIAELMAQGFGIQLRAPQPGETDIATLAYRTVETRVVYAPLRKGWRLWRGGQRREASGDLFLRLEKDGRVVWTERVKAFDADRIAGGRSEWLGGGDMVERTVVQPNNKLIERGLSASIIGGLFYIFFIL